MGAALGDAVLGVTGAERINYEILGNAEPALHAHVIPRYEWESAERRRQPVWSHDWTTAPGCDTAASHGLQQKLTDLLRAEAAE